MSVPASENDTIPWHKFYCKKMAGNNMTIFNHMGEDENSEKARINLARPMFQHVLQSCLAVLIIAPIFGP